ncbi:tetratricopeptide repeat protein, partial [Streptomyces melanogenes]|uniref:tetratricopeptide repeat protein n=1 Tax=Streptomyces melanogenes TaxID=67326 RepID=UPI0037A118F5
MTLASGVLRPMAEVDARPGLDNLPHRGVFVGRTRELDLLDVALAGPGEVVVQAVHGLGGIGKSALAAHWAATRACRHRGQVRWLRPHRRGYAPVRWITADSAVSVQQGLADLATALQPALALSADPSTEAQAERAMEWLASHTGWLLILDNVNDRHDIDDLLGRARTGRFLITSRLSAAWPDAATILRLDVLEEADSLALLTRTACASTGPRDMDGAPELCAELGHLALAIEQAAAYLAQSPLLTPRGYLTLLAQAPATLYQSGGSGVTDSERTIARVWRVTLDRIHHEQPLATDLLRILAWYAPDRIPAALLDDAADPPALTSALGLLTAYNMVTADPTTHTLTVHRLVQALARTTDPPDPDNPDAIPDPHRAPDLIAQARNHATTHLHTAIPSYQDPSAWPTWHALLPHIDALINHAPPGADTSTTRAVLNWTGLFLDDQGSTARAITYLERAVAAAVRLLGHDHPDTLTSHNNLAGAYESAGDLARAIPLFKQTLKDRQRVLGEDHRDTLTSRNNLAGAYESAGDLARAIPLFKQTLKDRQRVLG